MLSNLMEQKLVAISDSLAIIPEYYSIGCGAEASLDEFPGFGTSHDDGKTKMPQGEGGELLNFDTGSTENLGVTGRDEWSEMVGSIRRTSSPVLGLICNEGKKEVCVQKPNKDICIALPINSEQPNVLSLSPAPVQSKVNIFRSLSC